MHVTTKALLAATALFAMASAPAMALPTIPGNSSFQIAGSLRAVPDETTFVNTTGFDFGQLNPDGSFTFGTAGGYAELGGNGSPFYRDQGGTGLGFIAGTPGTSTDLAAGSFDNVSSAGSNPKAVPVINLYSFTKNSMTLSFDLATITDVQRITSADTGNQTVTVNGNGTVHFTGYEDALATFSITATRTGNGLAATFSSSVTTADVAVPEPMSLALLGTGLVAMGLVRRKQANSAS